MMFRNICVLTETILIVAALLCCLSRTAAELEGVVESSASCPCASKPKDKAFYCVEKVLDSVPSCVASDAKTLAIRVNGPSDNSLQSRFKQLDRLALSDLSARELPADFFASNTRLTAVILRECPHLERVSQEIFWPLSNLTEVSIFDSGLRGIANGTFRYSKLLKDLSLYNNSLISLPADLLDTTNLKTISLESNPWHCDCSMVEFQKALELKGVATVGNATCFTPEVLRGTPLKDFPEKVNCDEHQIF